MALLREGLLSGRSIALAGGVPDVISAQLSALGARVELYPQDGRPRGEQRGPSDVEQAGEWARAHAPLHGLIFDAGGTFGTGGQEALAQAIEHAWTAVREVATGALIPAKSAGKVVLVGPRPDAGPMAQAARAGLENLARTLSVEWARYEVTVAMVAPGASTDDQVLAQLLAFICSPGGEYLSGCRIELGAVSR